MDKSTRKNFERLAVDKVGGSGLYNTSHERIAALFDLGPRGLIWIRNPQRRVGTIRSDGYVRVMVDGEQVYEHHLVYFLFHKEWADYRLSHYDGDRSNNSIKNIIEEGETYIRMSKYLGVRYDPTQESWVTVVIDLDFESYVLGPFDTEIEAAKAYDREQRKMYGPKAIFVNFGN